MAEITKDEEYYTLYDTLDKGISDYSCSDFIDKAENLFPKMEQILNELNGGLSNYWQDQVKDKTEEQSGGQLTETLLNTKSYVDDVIKQLGPNVENLKGKLKNYKNCYEQYLEANTTLNELKKNAPENPNEEDYSSLAVYSEAYQYFCDYQVTLGKQETKRNNYAEITNAAHSECETLISSINKLLDYTNNETASDIDSTISVASTNLSSTETTIDESGNTHVVTTMTNEDGTISKYEEVINKDGEIIASYKTEYYENGNKKSYTSFEKEVITKEGTYKDLRKTITYYEDETMHTKNNSYSEYINDPEYGLPTRYTDYVGEIIYNEKGYMTSYNDNMVKAERYNSSTKEWIPIFSYRERHYDSVKKQETVAYSYANYGLIDSDDQDLCREGHNWSAETNYLSNKYNNLTLTYNYSSEKISDYRYGSGIYQTNKGYVSSVTITYDSGKRERYRNYSEGGAFCPPENIENCEIVRTYKENGIIESEITCKQLDKTKMNYHAIVVRDNSSDKNLLKTTKETYDIENEDGTTDKYVVEKHISPNDAGEVRYINGVERMNRISNNPLFGGDLTYNTTYYDEEGEIDFKVSGDGHNSTKNTIFYENNVPVKESIFKDGIELKTDNVETISIASNINDGAMNSIKTDAAKTLKNVVSVNDDFVVYKLDEPVQDKYGGEYTTVYIPTSSTSVPKLEVMSTETIENGKTKETYTYGDSKGTTIYDSNHNILFNEQENYDANNNVTSKTETNITYKGTLKDEKIKTVYDGNGDLDKKIVEKYQYGQDGTPEKKVVEYYDKDNNCYDRETLYWGKRVQDFYNPYKEIETDYYEKHGEWPKLD